MAANSFALKLAHGLAHWVAKTLPPRQIIVGSERGARVYRLSRSAQITLITAAVSGLVWIGWMALALNAETRAQEQSLLIDLDIRSALDERDLVIAERNRLKSAHGTLHQELSVFNDTIAQLFGGATHLAIPSRSSAAAGVMGITNEPAIGSTNVALWTSAIENGIGALEQKMTSLQASRSHVIDLFATETSRQIAVLEGMIASTGLELDPLVKAARLRTPPRARPVETGDELRLVRQTEDASFADLNTQLTRLEDLQGVIRRLPIIPPVSTLVITSGFGKRRDPFTKRWKMHEGIDFRARKGSPIVAPAYGTVTFAGRKGSYGYFIEIDHGGGVRTRYGHMQKVLVKKRQKVSIGSPIGKVGNTGRSTGVHLHYEIRYRGRPQDPMKFITAGWHVFKN